MLRAILFDLDDTLMAQDASDDAALLATGESARARRGLDPHALAAALRGASRELWHAAPTYPYAHRIGISHTEGLWARFAGDDPGLAALRAWAPTYRREAWSRALLEQNIDDVTLAEELAETFAAQRRARHIVFPDAEPALRDLRDGYRLALVTNGAPDLQREKLRGSRLGGLFEAVIVSGEVGVGKPDPRVFALALEQLGVRPDEAVMVGDNPARDTVGAQRAGIKAVLIERPGLSRDLTGITPDARITTLDQLRTVL